MTLAKVCPTILPKVLSKVAVFSGGGGGGLPPVWGKLLLYAKGTIISGADVDQNPDTAQDPDVSYKYYRRDIKSGYHIFVDPQGDTITNHWDTTNATYLAWHDILLIDPTELKAADALDGHFFFDTNGDPIPRTMAEIQSHASSSNVVFFCQHNGEYELRIYNEVLSGQELADANSWCA